MNDIYEKYASHLLVAAFFGYPYAVLTYGPRGKNSDCNIFADKNVADEFLRASRRHGVIAHTCAEKRGPVAFHIPPVRGFSSFDR